MPHSRRTFLSRTLAATTLAVFPPWLLPSTTPGAQVVTQSTETPDALARRARALLLKGRARDAARLFQQGMALEPNRVRWVDGLRRSFATLNEPALAAEACRRGWLANPNNPAFVSRLARELTRLSMGSDSGAAEFAQANGQDWLLDWSAALFMEAVQAQPDNREFREGLRRTLDASRYRRDPAFRGRIIDRSLQQEAQVEALAAPAPAAPPSTKKMSGDDLEQRLVRARVTLSEARSDARAGRQGIRALQRLSSAHRVRNQLELESARRAQDPAVRRSHAEAILAEDPTHPDASHLFRRAAREQGDWSGLIAHHRQAVSERRTPFALLGLAKALRRAEAETKTGSTINEAIAIYGEILLIASTEGVYAVAAYDGAARTYALAGQFAQARQTITDGLLALPDDRRSFTSTLFISLAQIYAAAGDVKAGAYVLTLFLGDGLVPKAPIEEDEDLSWYLAHKALPATSPKQDLPAMHARGALLRAMGMETTALVQYQNILQISPEDVVAQRFVDEAEAE